MGRGRGWVKKKTECLKIQGNNSGEDCKPNTLLQIFKTVKEAILRYLRVPSSDIRVEISYLLSTVLQEAAWCGPTNRE